MPPQKGARSREDTLAYIPAVEPVLADVALDHKPAHVVGLPADTVQRGGRHLATVPKQRRNDRGAESQIRWAEIAEVQPREPEALPKEATLLSRHKEIFLNFFSIRGTTK